ncbi:transcriptional activator NhaR [Aestuariibacter salexigens]|uniref:transcriptional activator NhaR n=1 Tax=Aestuariibacter salexigens TaxID=226010 RepID=UPI00041B34EB|nr:transcriptional activator NhaR [Aestuariibacter salexigens]
MADSLNYKHLHYFWVVAHEGSIARASEKLHITPQTISGQLTLLEERIGHPLFDRIGRSLQLTETGRLVLGYANDIFELGKELADVLRGAPAVGTSEFIVSAASALPKTIVNKIIEPALHAEHDICLTCKEGPVESILADLAVHEVDMVLSDIPLNSGLSVKAYNHFLGESVLTFFASPTLARTVAPDFPLSLHKAPMLLPTKQYAIRQQFDRWTAERDIFPLIKGQFDDSALMKSFGQHGHGLFFMPSIIEQEVCQSFDVEVVGRISELKQRFYAITAERKIKHPAVATICEVAREKIFSESLTDSKTT